MLLYHTLIDYGEHPPSLSPRSLLLGGFPELLLPLLLKIFLLCLGIQSLEFGIPLSLLCLLAFKVALLGLLILLCLLDLFDSCVTDCLDLAKHLGTKVGRLGEQVCDAHKLLEDGDERLVAVVGWEAIL